MFWAGAIRNFLTAKAADFRNRSVNFTVLVTFFLFHLKKFREIMMSPLLNKYYAFGFWLVNVLLAYMNIYLFTLNSSFKYGEVKTQNFIDSKPKNLQNSEEIVIMKPYTIAVIHKMTAMGVDELDQDIRMAHRIG